MPTFEDEKDLPLVTAFYMEAFRWRPVSVGGAIFPGNVQPDMAESCRLITRVRASRYGRHRLGALDPRQIDNGEADCV